MADLSNSGSGKSSTNGNNQLGQSPFGRLKEVLSEKDFANLFSGVGDGKGGGSPFGGGAGGGSQPDLAYGGNPFAGDNFWNIFAGGVNPSKVGGSPSTSTGNQNSGYDPLTGSSSQTYGISTTEIPDGFTLRATIDKLVNSKLDKEVGSGQTSPFPTGGQTSPFPTGGQTSPFPTGGQTGGQNPFA